MTPTQDFTLCAGSAAILVLFAFLIGAWDRYVTRKFYAELGRRCATGEGTSAMIDKLNGFGRLVLVLCGLGLLFAPWTVIWRVTYDLEQQRALQAEVAETRAQAVTARAQGFAEGRFAGLAEAADIRRAAETAQKAFEPTAEYPDREDCSPCPVCQRAP